MAIVNFGDVWDSATGFVTAQARALAPLAIGAILVPSLGLILLSPLAKGGDDVARIAAAAAMLALALVSFWGKLALVAFALEPRAGRTPAMQRARARLPLALGLSLLVALGAVLLVAPLGVIAVIGGAGVAQSDPSATPMPSGAAATLACLYVAVMIAVFLVAAARLILLAPVVLMELQGMRSFRRAIRLTRGLTPPIVGVVILYVVVAVVTTLAARFAAGAVFGLLLGGEGSFSAAAILTALVVAVVSTLLTVIASAYVGRLYLAVRDAREAIVNAR